MMRALLIGKEPAAVFGYEYVQVPPFDAVVIGSLSLGQLLRFREEAVLQRWQRGSRYSFTPRDSRKCRKTGHWREVSPLPSGN